PSSTTISALKQAVAEELKRNSIDGIKILFQRKPVADAKTVLDIVGEEGVKEVEFGVMVMGGAAVGGGKQVGGGQEVKDESKVDDGDVPMGGVEGGDVPVAQGMSGEEVMQSADFWDDLKGWLLQRVRDEGKVEEVWSLFKRGWDER
ncbi:MAG: hypothetical protein Q9218_005948, partial [Villophora microphyllina]